MSLKTKIRGFTAWVNLRLKPYDELMSNVMMDLLTGTNLKLLLHSLTGRELKRLESFDGLSQQQKQTRVEWVLEELKKCKVIPQDVFIDSRLFAMRSADHVFKLLWRLCCHDIWFVWERVEYLQHESDAVLTEVPFKWIPEPPPVKKKKAVKSKSSLLSGFGASSVIVEKNEDDDETDELASYNPYPKSEFMKKFKVKGHKSGHYPPANECIMEMVNKQLKTIFEGRKLNTLTVDDLVDSRVLCALANSFVPNLFTTEVLLNDRWTINLVLTTVQKLFYFSSPFESEDLTEADPMAVCAHFSTFFMVAFKYRQSRAVVNQVEHLKKNGREKQEELDKLLKETPTGDFYQRQNALKSDIESIRIALERIERKFDLDFCYKWMEHVKETVKETHKLIRDKIRQRYDVVSIPRNISINDLCLSLVINLSLTSGSGFYLLDKPETFSEGRHMVLRDKATGNFLDETCKGGKGHLRKLLRLPQRETVNIDPKKQLRYDVFVESMSKNRSLYPGCAFLYQVFPTTVATWHKVFLRAIKDNEVETVERMSAFFLNNTQFINFRESQTGNSALHWACKLGHYSMVQTLLESGAAIDQRNSARQTPLMVACESIQREVAHLLIEWGCDVHVKGPRNMVAFEMIRNDELRVFLVDAYDHYSTKVPKVMEGDIALLQRMIDEHKSGYRQFNNLRSRCINGSTLLHTAAYFESVPLIQTLLQLGVDVNLLDYKGASALHRARGQATILILLDAGASPSVEDSEGNTPLHVKCYGETGKPSEAEAISTLLENGAKLTARNSRGLMPIHCCAMQGRVDLIEQLLACDADGIQRELAEELGKKPPSVVHLAVANDYLPCAEWLLEHGFGFKDGEQDVLMQRVLSEQIKLKERSDTVKFLLDHGADVNPLYPGANTALHYAASMSGSTDVLELLIAYGGDLDFVNEDGATPLFYACQCNNQFATSVLISHGANVRLKNLQGLTAFDFILDYDEWIECGYFSDEIRARLKAYSLKHARDLIRAISKKVKSPMVFSAPPLHSASSSMTMTTRPNTHLARSNTHTSVQLSLPRLQQQQGQITM